MKKLKLEPEADLRCGSWITEKKNKVLILKVIASQPHDLPNENLIV